MRLGDRWLVALVTVMLITLPLSRADAQAGDNAAPSTQPVTRRAVVVPPGFRDITLDGTRLLVQEADEPWVREAMAAMRPATRPTTMPSDLLAALQAHRGELLAQMKADLALADDAPAARMLDEKLIPVLQKMAELRPPLVYLVSTKSKLKELMRNGWDEPRFHYNRLADDVTYREEMTLSIEKPIDDIVIPTIYGEQATPQARIDTVIAIVRSGQAASQKSISLRSQFLVYAAFHDFVIDEVMKPLSLRSDQQWFSHGVGGVLAARYMVLLGDGETGSLIAQLTRESRREPVKMRTLDALHPTELSDLRPGIVGFYIEAVRRKGMLAVDRWLTEAPTKDALPKVLTSMRQQMPADGVALVELIREQSGVDLTKDLSAQ